MSKSHELSNFIWSIADLLRGPYRPPQYERVMLPLVVLRRFDCALESTKDAVLAKYAKHQGKLEGDALDSVLNKVSGQRFHNHSPLSFAKLKGDPDNAHLHLVSYINGFSENVRKIFERFDFGNEIQRMHEHNILFLVIKKFCEIDLHPDVVDNIEMGLLFEGLIRRFNEQANETAGDHFTPREVIRLMVHLLFMHDDDLLTKPGTMRKMLDPTCGTGGMLSEARKYLREHSFGAKLYVYGQDFNPRSYAVAASDLPLRTDPRDAETSTIKFVDTLIDDQFEGERFNYFLANMLKSRDSKWRAPQTKAFRDAFTEVDPKTEAVIARKSGNKIEYEPDPKLRDFENVPLKQDVAAYFEREVKPHVKDAWIDHEKTKVGYEINFNRHFYRFTPPRPLAEIDADLKRAEEEIVRLLREVTTEMRA